MSRTLGGYSSGLNFSRDAESPKSPSAAAAKSPKINHLDGGTELREVVIYGVTMWVTGAAHGLAYQAPNTAGRSSESTVVVLHSLVEFMTP